MICFPAVFSNFILITIAIPDRSFVFILTQFYRPFRFTKVNCLTVTTVNFINDVVFIFCSYSILWFTKEFMQSHFSVESRPYFMRSVYIRRSFSLVPSTYGKFILVLMSSSWISVACVSCCD